MKLSHVKPDKVSFAGAGSEAHVCASYCVSAEGIHGLHRASSSGKFSTLADRPAARGSAAAVAAPPARAPAAGGARGGGSPPSLAVACGRRAVLRAALFVGGGGES